MSDWFIFQVLSFLLAVFGIAVILIVVLPAGWLLDRLWPNHPRGIRGHENLVNLAYAIGLGLVILIAVLVQRSH